MRSQFRVHLITSPGLVRLNKVVILVRQIKAIILVRLFTWRLPFTLQIPVVMEGNMKVTVKWI